MTPTFTVLIGSLGRPSLKHTLDSIKRQSRVPGDQVIVSIDAFEQGERQEVQDFVHSYGEGFIACAYDAGYHEFGVEQINYAWRTIPITGSHIFTIGDDDVFVDAAYSTLRPFCAAEPDRPILYRFLTPAKIGRCLLWDQPRLQVCRISGCCIAAPRKFVEPMETGHGAIHDFFWIEAIVKKSGVDPLWLNYVGVIACPDRRGDSVAHAGVWECWHCKRFGYKEDRKITDPYCVCGAVLEINPTPQAVGACYA